MIQWLCLWLHVLCCLLLEKHIKLVKTKFFKNDLKGVKILLLGVTYKEDIGDTRNSPSELFFKKMLSMGAKVEAHDPLVDYWNELNMKVNKTIPDINKFS